jgi:5-methylcytosine-specific restriction endonuclease McrA
MRNHNDCLVLNADYSPIGIIDWKKAVVWSFRYINSKYSSVDIVEIYKNDYAIGAQYQKINIPAVIKTNRYFKVTNQAVNFSRKNLFIRDNYTCQYCGARPNINQLTYDHVIPKSKWPHHNKTATSWTNIVTACFKCNCKKGNKTPQQANMTLNTKPYTPQKTRKYLHVSHQLLTIRNKVPDEWKLYIQDFV